MRSVRIFHLELVTKAPLHVGGERGIRPALIDLKVERRVYITSEGKVKEVVVIPGSTIKGMVRSGLEDLVRVSILSLMRSEGGSSDGGAKVRSLYRLIGYSIASAALALMELGMNLERGIRLVTALLYEEQQVISEDLLSVLHGCDVGIREVRESVKEGAREALSATSVSEGSINRLANAVALLPLSVYPAVCDPTSPRLACVTDTALIDLASDPRIAAKYLLSITLLRKVPLCIEVCPICAIFGATGRASPISFGDAEPMNLATDILPIRTRVSIDRSTWAARKGKLFTLEYVPPGTVFRAKIAVIERALPSFVRKLLEEVEGEEGARDATTSLAKLIASILEYKQVGGMKSVGMGWVKVGRVYEEGGVELSGYSIGSALELADSIAREYVKLLRQKLGEIFKNESPREEYVSVLSDKLRSVGLERDDVDKIVRAVIKAVSKAKEAMDRYLAVSE